MIQLKKIIIGDNLYIPSESEYRKTLLVGVCAIIMAVVCAFNWSLNTFLWDKITLTPIFLTGIFGGVVVFILNRINFFETAKHVLLLVALGMLFIFISNSGKYYGAQLYLFCVIVAAIFLFGFKKKIHWITYSLLAFLCFAVSEFKLIVPIQLDYLDTAKEDYIYFMNFLFSSLIVALVIYYQAKLQYKSEQILLKKDLALKESEERFRLAVEGTNAGIWDWENINNDQQWWSPKLYELLGYKPEEIPPTKMSFKNLLAEKSDYPRLVKELQNHLFLKEPFSVEYKFKVKDGSYKWFQGSGQAKWNTNEAPLRMVGSMVDITEKKRKEDEIREKNELLEKTNAELDRFVYSVSHDLRAPLNSIQGLINVGENTDDLNELKPLMTMMSNRVKKLYGFIDEIINFAKNTRTEIQREKIVVKDFLEDVINNAQYREQANTIDFQVKLAEDFTLYTDASRLGIILNNLVDNAIKYHRHGAQLKFIKVLAEKTTSNVVFKVIDNGQGIPTAAQDKIFDMFYRASDHSKGSGLGLYIVKDMVERIGGKISLVSNYGDGSTFTISLPQD